MNTPYLPENLRKASIGPVRNQRPGPCGWSDFALRLRACTRQDTANNSTLQQTTLSDRHGSNAIAIANGLLAALISSRRH